MHASDVAEHIGTVVSFVAKSTCLPLNKISRQDRLISNTGIGILVLPYLGIHPKKKKSKSWGYQASS